MNNTVDYTKVLKIADDVRRMAENALRPLDKTFSHWPPEFQSIMWAAVVGIAHERQAEAEDRHRANDNPPPPDRDHRLR